MIEFIEFLKVVIISIVQGITEWLPISSTGHMIIIDEFLKLSVTTEFKDLFLVFVQLGSILAVVVLYFHKLNPLSPKKNTQEKKDTWKLWSKVLVACLPAAILGLLLDDYITEHFFNAWVVAIALIFYGILFIIIENRQSKKREAARINSFEDLTYKDAAKIGAFQVLSLVPGTSRSGSTIIGGLLTGTSRYIATEFSFFMGIPIMFGASLLKIVKFGFSFTASELIYLSLGMAVSFIVSVFAIKFLINYIKKNNFTIFGYYRIALGILVILYFIFF